MAVEFNHHKPKRLKELVLKQSESSFHSLIEFIFPSVCSNCLSPIEISNNICPSCWEDIDFIMPPYCEIKGTPFPFNIEQGTISASALKHPPSYDKARSVALYEGTMRELIHKLKYKDRHELTNLFVNWMKLAGNELLNQTDIIIPIPLYKTRLWQRRFNQSALLAKRLSKQTNLPYDCSILTRRKKTKSQVGLTAKERQQNLKNAFFIEDSKKELIEDKSILLIDDVITTGVTVNTAASILKHVGASKVYILSLAIVSDTNNNKN